MDAFKSNIQYGYQDWMGKDNFIYIAHLIEEKRFDEAISIGEKLYSKNPNDEMICINLMVAFNKINKSNKYNNTVIKYARAAMINGHNTGYAASRLCITLYKEKRYNAVINVCNAVLNIKYHFSAITDKSEFYKRKQRAQKKALELNDCNDDIIFNSSDFELMTNTIDRKLEEHHKELLDLVKKRHYSTEEDRIKDIEYWNKIIKRNIDSIKYMESFSIKETFKY